MKRAKTVEAVLAIVAVAVLIGYAAYVARELREIGPIVPDTQASIHAPVDIGCEFWCKMVVTWLINQAYQVVKNNGCDGACGGGGGGGFACSDNDPDPNCRMDTW